MWILLISSEKIVNFVNLAWKSLEFSHLWFKILEFHFSRIKKKIMNFVDQTQKRNKFQRPVAAKVTNFVDHLQKYSEFCWLSKEESRVSSTYVRKIVNFHNQALKNCKFFWLSEEKCWISLVRYRKISNFVARLLLLLSYMKFISGPDYRRGTRGTCPGSSISGGPKLTLSI